MADIAAELQNTVLINENIKMVIWNCFEINLMGLNAILLAKRAGRMARGFGVISGELRELSLQLQGSMNRLSSASQDMLAESSHSMTQERRSQMLSETSELSAENTTYLAETLGRNKKAADDHSERLRMVHQRLAEYIDEAYQACVFGVVIARAARIESAYSGEHSNVLAELSNDFASKVDSIVPRLEELRRISGKMR
jgi:septal ring factor EnvC (AmiA/AmiB activator)